jgi:hypothetical protein
MHRDNLFTYRNIYEGMLAPSSLCIKKLLYFTGVNFLFVIQLGLEPRTPSLKGMCSTS